MPAIAYPDPPLTDGTVVLRAWADRDVAWLARESRDPLVPRFTTVPEGNSKAMVAERMLAQGALLARGEQVELLAAVAAGGERIGPVGLHRIDWAQRTGEVGYWTAAAMRGRGLTTAAVRVICTWAFDGLGLDRVELRADVDNTGSQRVAERAGFTREGVLRGAQGGPRGRRSIVVYGLLPGELT